MWEKGGVEWVWICRVGWVEWVWMGRGRVGLAWCGVEGGGNSWACMRHTVGLGCQH